MRLIGKWGGGESIILQWGRTLARRKNDRKVNYNFFEISIYVYMDTQRLIYFLLSDRCVQDRERFDASIDYTDKCFFGLRLTNALVRPFLVRFNRADLIASYAP